MPNIWTGNSKLKTFTCMQVQAYETKHECYNLLNCEFEDHCKDACFFLIKLPANK